MAHVLVLLYFKYFRDLLALFRESPLFNTPGWAGALGHAESLAIRGASCGEREPNGYLILISLIHLTATKYNADKNERHANAACEVQIRAALGPWPIGARAH